MNAPVSTPVADAAGLTRDQLLALRWLQEFPQTKAGWRRNGRPAYGDPKNWDTLKIEGPHGSIVIRTTDWEAILPFTGLAAITLPPPPESVT